MMDQSLLSASVVGVRNTVRALIGWLTGLIQSAAIVAMASSAAHAAPLKYYVLAPEHLAGNLSVMSLEPGNVITAGAAQLSLAQYDTGTIPAVELYPGLVIQGTKAFVVGSTQSAADLLAPDTFAGTSFIVPHVAGQHKYFILSPSGTAAVTVQLGGNAYNVQANEGVVNEFDAGSDNAIAGRITSDVPIVLAHVAYVSGAARDAYPVPPAATEVVGIRSQNAVVAAATNGTSVTVYASDGASATYTLSAGEKATVAVGASLSQGQGAALRLVSNYPIAAVQYDDGDGSDMTAFWGSSHFGRRLGVPVGAQYLAVACTDSNVSVTLYKGSTSPETQVCSSSGNAPGKVYFGDSSGGAHLGAGWYLISSAPVCLTYEVATSNDEANNLGLSPAAGPAAPTLDSVSSPTSSNPRAVTGDAGANQSVRLYVNGRLQATTTANGSGDFSFNAELNDNNNVLYATAVTAGNESDPSNAVNVVFNSTVSHTQSGSISGTVVWTAGNPATPYTITANLTVAAGARLILQPGTTLQFANGTTLIATGELKVAGAPGNPVTLTSGAASPVRGSWVGVQVNGNASSLIEYAVIEYASTGVNVVGVTTTVRNNTIRYFSANGVYVTGAGTALVKDNLIDNLNDTANCIYTNAGSPTVQGNTLTNCAVGLRVYGSSAPTVNGNNLITSNAYGVYADGNLTANPAPVVNGNQIFDNTTVNFQVVDYTTSGWTLNVNARNNWWGTSDPVTIEAKIAHRTDDYTNTRLPTVDWSGVLDGPGGTAATNQLLGSLTATATTLTAATYDVLGVLTVPTGKTLTIPAGATLRFHGVNARLIVDGTLSVAGTVAAKVRFTSASAAPTRGSWPGILIRSSATSVVIDSAEIEWAARAIEVQTTTAIVRNSLIRNFSDDGIRMTSSGTASQITGNYVDNLNKTGECIVLTASSPLVSGNRLHRCDTGLYMSGASAPTVSGNIITDNNQGIVLEGSNSNSATAVPNPVMTGNDVFGNALAQLEVRNYGSSNPIVINATGNWWGTTTPTAGQQIKFTSGSPVTAVNFTSAASAPLNGTTAGNVTVSEPYISPNGDGVKEQTTIQGTLSQSSSWTLAIKAGNGSVVRSYTGTGTTLSAVWDGTNGSGQLQLDGEYWCEVSVPGSPNPITVGVNLAVLDNTLPLAVVSIPTPSAVLQNVIANDVQGTVSDTHLVSYTLEYGAGATPSSWATIQSQTSGVTAGLLGTWTVGSTNGSFALANGPYALRLRATDLAGNANATTVPVTLDNISISGVTQNLQSIRPLQSETLQVSFALSDPATAYLRIYPEQGGALVREVSQSFASAGAKTLAWDAKNTSGNYVVDEAYTYVLVIDDGTRTSTYDLPIPDDGIGSGTGAIDASHNPSKNDFWKMNYSLSALKGRVRMQVSGCGIAGTHLPYDWVPFVPGVTPLIWDGRNQSGAIVAGACSVYFDAPRHLKPNSVIVRGTRPAISGTGVSPNIEVKSNPYRATHSFEQVSKITYRVDQDSYVTVKLLPPGISDPASPQAIVLVNNELQGAQSGGVPLNHEVDWKGFEDADTNNILVAGEGTYTFTIQATSVATSLSTLYRGALQLWQ
jgi:parallel beta-helix repeat protein